MAAVVVVVVAVAVAGAVVAAAAVVAFEAHGVVVAVDVVVVVAAAVVAFEAHVVVVAIGIVVDHAVVAFEAHVVAVVVVAVVDAVVAAVVEVEAVQQISTAEAEDLVADSDVPEDLVELLVDPQTWAVGLGLARDDLWSQVGEGWSVQKLGAFSRVRFQASTQTTKSRRRRFSSRTRRRPRTQSRPTL